MRPPPQSTCKFGVLASLEWLTERARLFIRRSVSPACWLVRSAAWFCAGSAGGVSEWLKETDCKSVRYAYAGSNPAPSTTTDAGR